jgi:hypothetical protein
MKGSNMARMNGLVMCDSAKEADGVIKVALMRRLKRHLNVLIKVPP